MAASFEEITQNVLALPRPRQLVLVRLLLSLDRSETSDALERWDEEVRARVHAVDEGRATAIPYEEIKADIAGCLRSR